MAGLGAVILVVALTALTGPGDLSWVRRLFVWCSTAAFSVWLLRVHRRRIHQARRVVIFLVCSTALVVLFAILTVSAF